MKSKLKILAVFCFYRMEIYQRENDGKYVWRCKYKIRYTTTILAMLILSVFMLIIGGVRGTIGMWGDTFIGKTKENGISGLTTKPKKRLFAKNY